MPSTGDSQIDSFPTPYSLCPSSPSSSPASSSSSFSSSKSINWPKMTPRNLEEGRHQFSENEKLLSTETTIPFFGSTKATSNSNSTLTLFNHHEFNHDSGPPTITVTTSGDCIHHPKSIPEVLALKNAGDFFWLNIQKPTQEMMNTLSKEFGFHSLTVEDILVGDTREKCEIFDNYYFICIRSFEPYSNTSLLIPINVFIILSSSFILTFHHKDITHVQNVLDRMKRTSNINSDWIAYALIDDIIDLYLPTLRTIEMEVDSIEELVLILKESEATDMLRRMGYCRRRVMVFHRLLSNKTDLLQILLKKCSKEQRNKEIPFYLEDIKDHLITMMQNSSHFEKTLSRSYSNYLAHINIELTQSSNRINDTAGRLTVLASFMVPMNLITGLWGMNVRVPGQDEPEGFYLIILFIFLSLGAMYFYARKHHFL